jgi:hypothetical protein
VLPARPAITKQEWRPKNVVPWFESKFMADKAIITLRRKIWAMHCWSSSLDNFDLCECFLTRKLYQKTGGHMFAPKIGTSCLTGQTCGSHRSDRCCQRPWNTIWASPLDRSCRVDQDSYVERPNWSPDEGDMTYTRSARRVHWSDRCSSPVWLVPPCPNQKEEAW